MDNKESINLNNMQVQTAVENLWNLINSLINKIDYKSDEIISLKEIISSKTSQLEDDAKTIDSLGNKVKELEQKQSSLEDILTKQRNELQLLTANLDETNDFKNRYEELNLKFEELNSSYINYEAQSREDLVNKIKELEDSQTNYTFLQKELARKNFELLEKEEIIKNTKEERAELDSKVYTLKESEKKSQEQIAKINQLQDSLNEITLQRDSLIEKNKDFKQNSDIQAYENKIRLFKEELEKQVENTNALNLKLQINNEEKNNLLLKLRSLEEQLNSNQSANNNDLNHTITDLERQLHLTKEDLTAKSKQVDELNLKLKQLTTVSLANQSSTDQLVQRNKDLEHKLSLKKQEEEQFIARIELEQSEKNKLKAEVARLSEQTNAIKLSGNDELLANMSSENESLLNQIKILQDQNNEYISEKKLIDDLLGSKENLLSETIALNELYKLKNEQLVSSLMEKEKTIDELLLDNAKHGQSINLEASTQLSGNINYLNEQLSNRDKTISQLQDKLSELERLIKKRYEQIEILENQLNIEIQSKSNEKALRKELSKELERYIHKIEELVK